MNEVVEQYKRSLERKERLLNPYYDKKRQSIDLGADEYGAMLVLEAEIRLIKEFLEDLDYFKTDMKEKEHVKMSLEEKLNDKDFELISYEEDKFYSKTLTSIKEVEKFHKIIGEDSGQFEHDYTDVKFTLEINSELTFAQYLFSDVDTGGGWFTHDQLTREEFEELLDHI